MRLDEIKDIVCAEIDSKADHLVSLAKDILHTPETGFREFRTAERVAQEFVGMGIKFEQGIGLTGLKGVLNAKDASGPNVAVMGE